MKHVPVLLDEIISYLNIKPDGVYVDATLGGGGHAEAVLEKLDSGQLFAFDQDLFAIEKARERLKPHADKLTIIHDNFETLAPSLAKHGVEQVDGIYFDLGVSSFHFDDASRGFSYKEDAWLDMRMNQNQTLSAHDVVNTYEEVALANVLFEYGDESFGRRIAKNIVKRRQQAPINTTLELVEVIKQSLPQKVLSKKGHPAKRSFQAIRIEVNQELAVLKTALASALNILKPGGRCLVISFQSLEDKIVKSMFKDKTTIDYPKGLPVMPDRVAPFKIVGKKAIKPSQTELKTNHRAHSAILRVIEKR